MLSQDEKFMLRALKLAQNGGRAVASNPMVGAVIVKNGKRIGKGYHKKFGGPHAEVDAIKSVKNKEDLKGATMYVTLEPCRHHGKTPPCFDLVAASGIAEVVCGSADPNCTKCKIHKAQIKSKAQNPKPKLRFLRGEVAKQCRELNKFFFTWVEKKRPFVTVKVAVSADGFVAGPNGEPVRLTTAKQDKEVHQLRADHQAIMVGVNTVLNDDPELTVRHVKGPDPLRVILDSNLRIPKTARVLKDGNFLIATTNEGRTTSSGLRGGVWISPTKKRVCLRRLLKHLAEAGISSVLVEPGPTLYLSLKRLNLIDELVVYRSKKKLNQGMKIDL